MTLGTLVLDTLRGRLEINFAEVAHGLDPELLKPSARLGYSLSRTSREANRPSGTKGWSRAQNDNVVVMT